jgi:hypothetical protein
MLKEFSFPKGKERGYSGGSVPEFHRFPYYAQRATIKVCNIFLSLFKSITGHCQDIYSNEKVYRRILETSIGILVYK